MNYVYYEYISYGYPIHSSIYYKEKITNRLDRFIALRYIAHDLLRRPTITKDLQITHVITQSGTWVNTSRDYNFFERKPL